MNMFYNKAAIESIKSSLRKRGETLSVAESVTSGHLQAALSLADGATQFFQGGITAYNLLQKTRLLKVDSLHAVECNCVSQEVANEMALESCNLFGSNWSIAVTGYAAPVEEAGIEDLFCFFSFAHDHKVSFTGKLVSDTRALDEVQVFYTNKILEAFANHLQVNP